MRAAGPALCALLLLACAQGDNVTDSTLVDDQAEALLAGEEAAAEWTWATRLGVAVLCCCPCACLTCWVAGALSVLFSADDDVVRVAQTRFSLSGDYMLPPRPTTAEELEREAKAMEEANKAIRQRCQEWGQDLEELGLDSDSDSDAMGQTGEEAKMSGNQFAYLHQVVRGETLLTTILPFFCALPWLVLALAFQGEPPAWLQIGLVLPPILRACFVEQRLAQKSFWDLVHEDISDGWERLKKLSPPPFPFLTAKLEVLDKVTDGLAIATVFVLERADPVFGARLEAAWHAGPIGRLFAPLVLRVGLSGLMLIVQVVSGASQYGAVIVYGAGLSEFAGLGTVASLSDAEMSARRWPINANVRKAMKAFVTKFLEGTGQLFLQSAAILAQGTGLLGEPSLAFSVALTSGLLLKDGVQTMCMDQDRLDNKLCVLVPGVLMCCVVAMVALRLGMSETCGDSLLYDVGSFQCVPAPLPTRS